MEENPESIWVLFQLQAVVHAGTSWPTMEANRTKPVNHRRPYVPLLQVQLIGVPRICGAFSATPTGCACQRPFTITHTLTVDNLYAQRCLHIFPHR